MAPCQAVELDPDITKGHETGKICLPYDHEVSLYRYIVSFFLIHLVIAGLKNTRYTKVFFI